MIVATVTSVIGGGLVESVAGGASDLAKISGEQDRMIAGASIQLIAAFASAGIGIALYPGPVSAPASPNAIVDGAPLAINLPDCGP